MRTRARRGGECAAGAGASSQQHRSATRARSALGTSPLLPRHSSSSRGAPRKQLKTRVKSKINAQRAYSKLLPSQDARPSQRDTPGMRRRMLALGSESWADPRAEQRARAQARARGGAQPQPVQYASGSVALPPASRPMPMTPKMTGATNMAHLRQHVLRGRWCMGTAAYVPNWGPATGAPITGAATATGCSARADRGWYPAFTRKRGSTSAVGRLGAACERCAARVRATRNVCLSVRSQTSHDSSPEVAPQ